MCAPLMIRGIPSMGMTSAACRRCYSLAMTSSACRKLEESVGRYSLLLGINLFFSGQEKTTARQGLYDAGSVVREFICRKSVHAHEFIDERIMPTCFALAGTYKAANFFVAYASTECTKDAEL